MLFTPARLIEVRAWGNTVGALAAGTQSRAYVFEYDSAWIRSGIQIAPLRMPLGRGPQSFPRLPAATYQWLPAAIADSLPDKFGNSIIDAWLVQNGVALNAVTALDRLAYLGDRALGALEFRPDNGARSEAPSAIDIRELVMAARNAISGQSTDASALQQIITVGTSAGGARAKAVVNINLTTNEIRPGHVPAQPGFEPWLLKFDGVGADRQLGLSQHYGRIEFAYSLMARAAGIVMAPTRLLEENGRAHFMTRRFDRADDGAKLHMQSLCAMAELDFNQIGTHDYAQYLATVQALGLGADAMAEAFRRLVFNVAAANCDDHTKNFGFLMNEAGEWNLAPAYDITHAYSPTNEWTHQHLMSVNGKFGAIARSDLLTAAERFNVDGAAAIIKDVGTAIRAWPEFASEAGLSEPATQEVAVDLRTFSRSGNQLSGGVPRMPGA